MFLHLIVYRLLEPELSSSSKKGSDLIKKDKLNISFVN